MKRMFLVFLALMLLSAVALADPAGVVETGTGITVIKAADWVEQYPDIYASYMLNEQNSEALDHTVEYPSIKVVYEGMAFNTYYASARGHYYTVEDVTNTGRPHALANCFTCKTPDFTVAVNNDGVSAYKIPFEDMLAQVNESISCYNCHANGQDGAITGVTVTHTYLSDALGADFAKVAAGTAACAQCHVEYYFDPETKATTLPYTSLDTMNPDSIYEYYANLGFSDYTNPRTGVQQIKVQHPEFETFMGEGSFHKANFTCADCHMGTATNEQGETYVSHNWVSPLASESIQAEKNCSTCHSDLAAFVHGIQEHAEERTIAIGESLEKLTNELAAAVEAGKLSDEELATVRELNRKGQFYWDFVFVENSEGAHNRKLTEECLDKAESFINQALEIVEA